jgi:uncharacterized membrane protein
MKEVHENDKEITDKMTHAGKIRIGKEMAKFL